MENIRVDVECTIVYVRCGSGFDDYHETHLIATVYSKLVPVDWTVRHGKTLCSKNFTTSPPRHRRKGGTPVATRLLHAERSPVRNAVAKKSAGSCIEKLAGAFEKKKIQVISTADESVSSRKDINEDSAVSLNQQLVFGVGDCKTMSHDLVGTTAFCIRNINQQVACIPDESEKRRRVFGYQQMKQRLDDLKNCFSYHNIQFWKLSRSVRSYRRSELR
ncbi:hypothetical protein F511_19680 [Dorcoceras hygrometricum]|uniref:Uncharacterized protein n=1 Tax=Dorcoceras hygrometricum TaxID=472368 RepID=A0A2Z7C3F4_9LAMI|nr:hypothetical protein F511_19680 [Dorcoceras hygrometricum]